MSKKHVGKTQLSAHKRENKPIRAGHPASRFHIIRKPARHFAWMSKPAVAVTKKDPVDALEVL